MGPNEWTPDIVLSAVLAARMITTDFSRAGVTGRQINKHAAFFNAEVQGWSRLAETFNTDPIGASLRIGALGLMSMALALSHLDDDEYDQLEEWEKHAYWHVRVGDNFVKIPKPFQYAYVPDLIEASVLYLARHDPSRLEEMKKYFTGESLQSAVFSRLPTVALPILEIGSNYSSFRDTEIVRPWDKDGVASDLQYNEFTSETAKLLGKVMPLAPALIDHLIFGYTAGFGRGVVAGVDMGLRATGVVRGDRRPAPTSQEGNVTGIFARDAKFSLSSRDIQNVYDYAELIGVLETSVKRDVEAGDTPSALRRVKNASEEPWFARRELILDTQKEFMKLGASAKRVYAMPPDQASPEVKRRMLDLIAEQMFVLSARALGRPIHSRNKGQ
jgi:hypothetical protein